MSTSLRRLLYLAACRKLTSSLAGWRERKANPSLPVVPIQPFITCALHGPLEEGQFVRDVPISTRLEDHAGIACRASTSEGRTAIATVVAGGSCIMQVDENVDTRTAWRVIMTEA